MRLTIDITDDDAMPEAVTWESPTVILLLAAGLAVKTDRATWLRTLAAQATIAAEHVEEQSVPPEKARLGAPWTPKVVPAEDMGMD